MPGPADFFAVLQAQTEALAQLPGTIAALNRTVRDFSATVGQAREAFTTLSRVATKAEQLLDELDGPVRELVPGLRRVAVVLDDPAVDDVPDTLRRLRDDMLPVVRGFRETQDRFAGIAAATDRLAGFPGASGFFGRRPVRPGESDPTGPGPG
jgi:ABC-type transporter Mla subunit MlaD